MAKAANIAYEPDYAVPPGETLRETLDSLSMTQTQLAARTGLSLKTISGIVKGKEALTPKTAIMLHRVLGIKASFWNNMEADYRAALAAEAERGRLQGWIDWAEKMPYKPLQQRGVLAAGLRGQHLVAAVLDFFGVSSPEAWHAVWHSPQAAFRSSPAFLSSPEVVATWLRLGELAGQAIRTGSFSEVGMKKALAQARQLSKLAPVDFCPRLTDMCAQWGVALVFVPELPGLRLSGASRWLTPEKALIQLSLRYKRNDQLWFTFFHEVGHLLLHGKKEVFIDGDSFGQELKEFEANTFAANELIPPAKLRAFLDRLGGRTPLKREVVSFADAIGIHSGIVVGRLQRDGVIKFNQLTGLFQRLQGVSPN